MYGINWPQLIAGIVVIIAVAYYIYTLMRTKDEARFDYIFSRSSQLTFITSILGFAIVIIRANSSNISGEDLANWVLIAGAIVCLVNMLSLIYYQHRHKKAAHKQIDK